jgi:mannose-1-phosphate guanylyltransferase
LLTDAVGRLEGLIAPERILVVTGRALLEETRRILHMLPPEQVLAEPRAASTGPALTWATSHVRERDPDGVVLSLHADWWVGDAGGFCAAADRALAVAASHDVLVTVGIVPTRADVGYGYIEPGAALDGEVAAVAAFTEKPNAARAAELVARGALWNSGLFAWSVSRFFAETTTHAREIAPHLPLLARGDVDGFFAAVTPIAIDVSHFERSRRVAVVPGRFPWDDVGTWAALSRVRTPDPAGNVAIGEVFARDCAGTVVWGDDGPVIVDGVHDLVVVRANGRVLVTTKERAGRLKDLLEAMPERFRSLP